MSTLRLVLASHRFDAETSTDSPAGFRPYRYRNPIEDKRECEQQPKGYTPPVFLDPAWHFKEGQCTGCRYPEYQHYGADGHKASGRAEGSVILEHIVSAFILLIETECRRGFLHPFFQEVPTSRGEDIPGVG